MPLSLSMLAASDSWSNIALAGFHDVRVKVNVAQQKPPSRFTCMRTVRRRRLRMNSPSHFFFAAALALPLPARGAVRGAEASVARVFFAPDLEADAAGRIVLVAIRVVLSAGANLAGVFVYAIMTTRARDCKVIRTQCNCQTAFPFSSTQISSWLVSRKGSCERQE